MQLIPGKLYQLKKEIAWDTPPYYFLKGTLALVIKIETEIVVRESKYVLMLVDGVYIRFRVGDDKRAEEYFRPCN